MGGQVARSSKKPSGKAHSISSLARSQGNRLPRKSILIVCGGTQTEPNYFESLRRELRLGTVNVVVLGRSKDPLKVVDSAIAERSKRSSDPFDEVWCVMDTEAQKGNVLLAQAIDKAARNGINLAISNPSFEYWFLLHFRETSQPFRDADQVIKVLETHLPDYLKTADIFAEIFMHTDKAIQRASRVLSQHREKGKDFPNPSTTVFMLVENIRKIVQ